MRNRLRVSRWVVIATTLTISASALGFPGVALAGTPPGECAPILPVEDLVLDTFGRGWTVTRGDTPEPFKVEYLGVLDDGIGADRDLIVVEVSDVAGSTIIQDANGIWAGISGSPVYSAGKLVGSVSYSFNAGAAFLAGVTPAEDMVKVLDYPASRTAEAAGAKRVPLSASIRAKLERRGRTSPRDASLERLPLPLAVSGLSTAHRARLQADMDRIGSPVVVSSGSRATRPTAGSVAGAPVPGGNFASVLAYGDFTAAGIGTTTYVCDGAALAFGHPMLFSGRATMGAHDASALAIVPGVSQAFKLANVTEPFGTVDQDRLAAIRADLGATPTTIPITSVLADLDLDVTRNGRTDVTTESYLPISSVYHLWANFDAVHDAINGGTATMRYTIKGHLPNGDTFELKRGNRYVHQADASGPVVDDLYSTLSTIVANPFADVTFDSVHVVASVTETYAPYVVEKVKISKNGGAFREREQINVRGGDQLVIRTTLRRYQGEARRVDIAMTIPADAVGDGFLVVGRPDFGFPTGSTGDDFESLIDAIRDAPRNDDLSAQLYFFGQSSYDLIASASSRVDSVVSGYREVNVRAIP